MAAPAAKVFGAFELLENILLCLPLRSLLLSQRINKACFDVVHGSPDIRRALFWEASSTSLCHHWDVSDEGEVVGDLEFRTYDDEWGKVGPPFMNPFLIM